MAESPNAHKSSTEYDVLAALDLDHQQFERVGRSSLFGDAAAEIRRLRAALAEAQGERPSGFWSQREWEDYSNDLATLIPEDDICRYSNPEGAQEGIISDCLAAYVAERAEVVSSSAGSES